MTWARGRDEVQRLIDDNEIERVEASTEVADRLRRKRNDTEYPSLTTPGVTTDEATQALGIARETIDAAKKLLDSGRLDEFH